MNNQSWKRENRSIIINDELTIKVSYAGDPCVTTKAIPLDHAVLPLIAAAPDLLSAAMLAAEQLESFPEYENDATIKEIVETLKQAIAKAAPTHDKIHPY
jgi:hypothetical protein